MLAVRAPVNKIYFNAANYRMAACLTSLACFLPMSVAIWFHAEGTASMKLDIKFPILARANPTTSRKDERYVYATHIHNADIREVSSRETEVVLGPVAVTDAKGQRRELPELRSHEGRIYRSLGKASWLFSKAHHRLMPNNIDLDGIKREIDPSIPPLAYPIECWIEWFIDIHGMETKRNYQLWPEPEPYRPGYVFSRNNFDFSRLALRDINAEDIELFSKMFAAQSDRLIIIGGKFWLQTTMPCVNVSLFGGDYRAKGVGLDVGFLPLVLNQPGSITRFPLDMLDEAIDFAHVMVGTFGGKEADDIGHVELPGSDLTAVSFDQDEQEVHSLALSIGSNLVRRAEQHKFHKIHAESPPLFTGQKIEQFEVIKAAVMSNNEILGERSNVGELLPEIVEMWSSVKRPRYDGLGCPPYLVEQTITRGLEKAENFLSINVPVLSMQPK